MSLTGCPKKPDGSWRFSSATQFPGLIPFCCHVGMVTMAVHLLFLPAQEELRPGMKCFHEDFVFLLPFSQLLESAFCLPSGSHNLAVLICRSLHVAMDAAWCQAGNLHSVKGSPTALICRQQPLTRLRALGTSQCSTRTSFKTRNPPVCQIGSTKSTACLPAFRCTASSQSSASLTLASAKKSH